MYVTAAETVPAAVTLDLAKAQLRITHDLEDALIETLMVSATQFVEGYTGLRLVERDLVLSALAWDPRWRLPKTTSRIISVDAAGTMLDPDAGDYVFGGGRALSFAYGVVGPLKITLRCGVAATAAQVPAQHQAPVLAALAHLYVNPEGQDFPAGVFAQMRSLPGGGLRL